MLKYTMALLVAVLTASGIATADHDRRSGEWRELGYFQIQGQGRDYYESNWDSDYLLFDELVVDVRSGCLAFNTFQIDTGRNTYNLSQMRPQGFVHHNMTPGGYGIRFADAGMPRALRIFDFSFHASELNCPAPTIVTVRAKVARRGR